MNYRIIAYVRIKWVIMYSIFLVYMHYRSNQYMHVKERNTVHYKPLNYRVKTQLKSFLVICCFLQKLILHKVKNILWKFNLYIFNIE